MTSTGAIALQIQVARAIGWHVPIATHPAGTPPGEPTDAPLVALPAWHQSLDAWCEYVAPVLADRGLGMAYLRALNDLTGGAWWAASAAIHCHAFLMACREGSAPDISQVLAAMQAIAAEFGAPPTASPPPARLCEVCGQPMDYTPIVHPGLTERWRCARDPHHHQTLIEVYDAERRAAGGVVPLGTSVVAP